MKKSIENKKRIRNDYKEAEKIYCNKRQKLIFEDYERKTILFDRYNEEQNPSKISNFIFPMYNYLMNKYKKENPTKNAVHIEIIYEIYLKKIFKISNPNNHHKFVDKMCEFLKEEKLEFDLQDSNNHILLYQLLKNFMDTIVDADKIIS